MHVFDQTCKNILSSDGFACVGLLKYWKVVNKDFSDSRRRNVFTRHDGKDFRITP